MMRHPRRQIQHVARIQHPVAVRIEVLQQPQRHIVTVARIRIGLAVDHPAALAHALHQKHIVVVDVRPHVAAGGRKAHHHIVHPPGRQETEVIQQPAHIGIPLVHVLHQQRPVMVGHARKLRLIEWPRAQRPPVRGRIVTGQPPQRPLLTRQPGQILRLNGRFEVRKGIADQHRTLLPVITQKLFGRHAERPRPPGSIDFERRQRRGSSLRHRCEP